MKITALSIVFLLCFNFLLVAQPTGEFQKRKLTVSLEGKPFTTVLKDFKQIGYTSNALYLLKQKAGLGSNEMDLLVVNTNTMELVKDTAWTEVNPERSTQYFCLGDKLLIFHGKFAKESKTFLITCTAINEQGEVAEKDKKILEFTAKRFLKTEFYVKPYDSEFLSIEIESDLKVGKSGNVGYYAFISKDLTKQHLFDLDASKFITKEKGAILLPKLTGSDLGGAVSFINSTTGLGTSIAVINIDGTKKFTQQILKKIKIVDFNTFTNQDNTCIIAHYTTNPDLEEITGIMYFRYNATKTNFELMEERVLPAEIHKRFCNEYITRKAENELDVLLTKDIAATEKIEPFTECFSFTDAQTKSRNFLFSQDVAKKSLSEITHNRYFLMERINAEGKLSFVGEVKSFAKPAALDIEPVQYTNNNLENKFQLSFSSIYQKDFKLMPANLSFNFKNIAKGYFELEVENEKVNYAVIEGNFNTSKGYLPFAFFPISNGRFVTIAAETDDLDKQFKGNKKTQIIFGLATAQ